MRDHLLGNLDRVAGPLAIRHRVPGDVHFLIRREQAQIGLIHERAHLNFVQISHVGDFLADRDVIARAHRKRIERAIDGRGDRGGAHFFFERASLGLVLLHAQSEPLDIERCAMRQIISSFLLRV